MPIRVLRNDYAHEQQIFERTYGNHQRGENAVQNIEKGNDIVANDPADGFCSDFFLSVHKSLANTLGHLQVGQAGYIVRLKPFTIGLWRMLLTILAFHSMLKLSGPVFCDVNHCRKRILSKIISVYTKNDSE